MEEQLKEQQRLKEEEEKREASRPVFKPEGYIQGKNLIDISRLHTNEIHDRVRECGYCKGKKENSMKKSAWGFTSPRFSTDDYEDLMNYGWIRCGTYFYKFDL